MKKTFTLLALLLAFTLSCYAKDDSIFLYKSTQINNSAIQIQKPDSDTLILLDTKGLGFFQNKNENKKSNIKSSVKYEKAYVASKTKPIQKSRDPYVIPINGINYVLVVDKTSQDWTHNDLFGIYDSKTDRFKSLISLDTNNDLKVTPQEIKNANIRMVQTDKQGIVLVNQRHKDYDLNNILYIDLKDLKRNANCEETGIFGHFNVYFKTSDYKTKLAVSYVTYDYEEDLIFMFK